jgi:Cytochrome c554 and c-prime
MKAAFLFFVVVCLFSFSAPAQDSRYIGAGGCASSNCHGATSPLAVNVSRIMGHEYSVWSVRDKHSQAYSVLSNDRSKRMAQILGIADATKATECLACHAAGTPSRSLSDGVACEACHGPAEQWLGPHATEGQTHAQNVALGMADTKNIEIRARMCLECHVGTSEKKVDHRLIAAGHPDLPFELDTFSAALPMHWRPTAPAAGNTLPSLRGFAVGQAVALSEGMRMLASAASSHWPEFAELECYQCHHDLRRDSWRIARGYAGRQAGSLLPNVSRFTVLRVVAAQAGGRSASLDAAVDALEGVVTSKFNDASAIAQAANRVKSEADALVGAFQQRNFTEADAVALARALDQNITRISNDGVQAAEQATMAIDAIVAAAAPEGVVLRESIRKLYDYLEHPSTYRPGEFAQLFRAVVRQLS